MKFRHPLLVLAAALFLSVAGTAQQSRIRPRPNPIRQTELNKGTSSLGSVARTLLLHQQQGNHAGDLGSIARRAALSGGKVDYMRSDKRIHPPRSKAISHARR
jgi:hypothetical protein